MATEVTASTNATEPTGDPSIALPLIRQDLQLLPGARHRDGSPSWRIHDPVRNQFFEIGWLEYELLARWANHADANALIAQVEEETALSPTEDEVEEIIDFLSQHQLLSPANREVRKSLRGKVRQKKKPWYETLLHHYLFFRLPLVRPDAFLQRTLPVAEIFFTKTFAFIALFVFLIDMFLVMREWHSFQESFIHFFSLTGVVYYALAGTFAKIIHELSHAYAAKRYGVRVPAMGLAFLVMWPYLYTDVAETWKLSDRRKQLVISSAGMLSELVLAVFATLLWAISPEGAMKSIFFILATTTWVMTLAINASPFMRFDGYFVVSDALDFPNLHERGTACGKWFLRTTFFGLPIRQPEPGMTTRHRVYLTIFALITWVYRLTVFIGIALLVYHLVLKLLGIFLMLVEVVWFIIRPFTSEAAYLWGRRKEIRIAWVPTAAVGLLALFLLWVVPVSRQVTAPAVLRAVNDQAIHAPFAAQLRSIAVTQGETVEVGALLAVLDSPELAVRWRQAEGSIASVQAELQRAPASVRQQEQQAVLQEQLAQALAEQAAVNEDAHRLEMRATSAGVIRDLAPDLVVGRWLNPRQQLMRIVSGTSRVIELYVSESQVGAVKEGQELRFYPSVPEDSVLTGIVRVVDRTPSRGISQPLLASTYGGELAAVKDPKEGLIAYDATFRVLATIEDRDFRSNTIQRGTARIDTDLRLVMENFVSRIIGLFIRESGF